MTDVDWTADELRYRSREAHAIAYQLEQNGDLLVGMFVSPVDAIAAVANLIRLRARRYDDRASAPKGSSND